MKENLNSMPEYYHKIEIIPTTKNDIHELASSVAEISNNLVENVTGEIVSIDYSSFYNSNTGLEVYTALIVARIRYEKPQIPTEEDERKCHCPLRYSEGHVCSKECTEFYNGCARDKCKYFYLDEES